jgi:signal transduction histidine kinase
MQDKPIEGFLPVSTGPMVHPDASASGFPLCFEHEIVIEGRPPAIVEALVNKSAVAEGLSEPVLVVTLRDVTLRKRMEEAEKRAAEEKLLAERSKSLFIANMSHELRTPLNAIIGFSEIMEAQSLGALGNPKYQQYAGIVLKSGQHLLEMVNNVLEISRLESGGIRPERRDFDLGGLIESCFAFIRNGRDYQGQSLRIDGASVLPPIKTDPRLLRQVLINLLSNAIKFSRPGEKNAVTVSASESAGTTRISVTDNGVGMSQETLSHVTDLFFQGDGSFARKHEGRGLGLYLAKKHVELLGGKMIFDSELGRGTTVSVDLPNGMQIAAASAA